MKPQNNHRLTTFTVFIALSLFAAACCTKKECLGFDNLNEVRFANFTRDETDSAAVEIFDNATRIDSFAAMADTMNFGGPGVVVRLKNRVDASLSYRITFTNKGINSQYNISEFNVSSRTCNCASDHYDILENYRVNGNLVSGNTIVVTK